MPNKALTIEPSSKIVDGIKNESIDITSIPEGANIVGSLLNKLGTSIPTPYARLHLFSSAFEEVNGNSKLSANSNYHKLVSLVLDMLEFLYLNGGSEELKIYHWNLNEQIELLKASDNAGHQLLGDALSQAWDEDIYQTFDIYLFEYHNQIIGGSSPLSLVYTNPNLRKTFPGLSNDHRLFDENDPKSLAERTDEFRLYIYQLFLTYPNSIPAPIQQYINNHFNDENNNVGDLMDDFGALNQEEKVNAIKSGNDLIQPNIKLKYNNQPVVIGFNMPLWVRDLSNVRFNSDYRISPTMQTYSQYELNGVLRTLKEPLVLNDYGLAGAGYINNTRWVNNSLPNSDISVPVYDRKLPGTSIRYPYLRAEDFFQDSIIQVSYNINRERFYTGLTDLSTVLTPLTKEFFKYFKPEDLDNMFKLSVVKDALYNIVKVKATLNIPLVGGRNIPLSKEYSIEQGNIIDLRPSNNTFDLAIFPVYKDISPNAKNEYDIMLGYSADRITLTFHKMEKPDYIFQPQRNSGDTVIGEMKESSRTTRNSQSPISTHYYHSNRVFDIIEVGVANDDKVAKGLVLPKFRILDSSNPAARFTFGVDFGTTNTHISYATSAADIKSFHIDNSVDNEDLQSAYLNNHEMPEKVHVLDGGFAAFSQFLDIARREFITSEISENTFPLRTAISEVKNLDTIAKPQLFGALNIGFNYSQQLIKNNSSNVYKTDLKWELTDPSAKSRIKSYFKELLLLMRNKSVLNNGSRNFSVVVTYPQAMNGRDETNFRTAWTTAAEEIGINPANISFHFESITPFYAYGRHINNINNKTYVNVDIGGGSTDIFYLSHPDAQNTECLTFSVKFAAGDLWGDGMNIMTMNVNGFLAEYEKSNIFKNLTPELVQRYNIVKNNSDINRLNSANIIDYLFSNEEEYRFTEVISNSRMMLLPILHFTSLIYYIGHIADSQDLNIPNIISLTGMGSLYANMIGSKERLAKLVKTILDYQTENQNSAIDLYIAEKPKKVTAEGAVIINHAQTLGINVMTTEPALSLGLNEEEPDDNLTVDNIRNNDVNGQNLSDSVLSHYEKIVNMMRNDNNYRQCLIDMGHTDALNAIPEDDTIMTIFKNGYDSALNEYMQKHGADNENTPVRESLFFWPLKQGLYELGLQI